MVEPSDQLHSVFDKAVADCKKLGHEYVTLEHLTFAMLCEDQFYELIDTYGARTDYIKSSLEDFIKTKLDDIRLDPIPKGFKPTKTHAVERVLNRAFTQVLFSGRQHIDIIDVFLSLLSETSSHAVFFISKGGIDQDKFLDYIQSEGTLEDETTVDANAEKALKAYTTNLNDAVKKSKIDPVIGRTAELEQIAIGLGRRTKNNVMLVGDPGVGKAQPLDAQIRTPTGWATMGQMTVGTEVLTPTGNIANVIGVFPQGKKDIYKITFADGRTTECCKEHLWEIYGKFGETYKTKGGYRNAKLGTKVVSTEWIIDKLSSNKNFTARIPLVSDLKSADTTVPIDPWLMGFLLGDGSFAKGKMGSFSTGDLEILDLISSRLDDDYVITSVPGHKYDFNITNPDFVQGSQPGVLVRKDKFRHIYRQHITDLGLRDTLSHTKFIPNIYKTGSTSQKLDLIAGLVAFLLQL
jgi:hypothetical protein